MKTYYSWECPPRTLMEGKWLDFGVDLDKVFRGEKIDKFTELPKFLEFCQEESKVLKQLDQIYYKIVADTNAYYLSPETVIKYGKKRIENIFQCFKRKVEQACLKRYGVGKVKVVLFTELIKDYKEIYEVIFTTVVASIFSYVSTKEFRDIKDYLKEHVGFLEGEALNRFATRVIASYIAEGVVIPKVFTGPIWVNYDEPPCLAKMTNRLNGKKIRIIKNYKKEEDIEVNK